MSKKSETNLILNINVSSTLALLLFGIHVGAMLLLALVPLSWPWRLGIWAGLAWSLYRSTRLHVRRIGPNAIRALERDGEGIVRARFVGRDDWEQARVTSCFIHPWLTLMVLRFDNRRWPIGVVIPADAVEAEAFRRWRVALRFPVVEE